MRLRKRMTKIINILNDYKIEYTIINEKGHVIIQFGDKELMITKVDILYSGPLAQMYIKMKEVRLIILLTQTI